MSTAPGTIYRPPEPKVYLARAGGSGEDEAYALDHDCAIISFDRVPSLEGAKDYDDVLRIFKAASPDSKPRAAGNYAGQLWAFAIAMKKGDLVVLPRKVTSQVALGRVTGPYQYAEIAGRHRHTRPVEWVRPDVARSVFAQDLLHSFGAFMTVCNITRNDAPKRIAAVLSGQPDPGYVSPAGPAARLGSPVTGGTAIIDEDASLDLGQAAHDQIVAHIQSRFREHALARLVNAVLSAEGWVTKLSPPGPDGGVDILAGRGSLGLDAPRLCVQVKSQATPADVTVYRTLQGSMHTFKAEQGLLVCWGGFNKAVAAESRQGHFSVRLWESRDLVEAIYRNYERLPAEIQAELPLKLVWMLVPEEEEA
jgi:restriction system protein